MLNCILSKNKAKIITAVLLSGTFLLNTPVVYAFPGASYIVKEGAIVLVKVVGQVVLEELIKEAYHKYVRGNNFESIQAWTKVIARATEAEVDCSDLYYNRGIVYAADGNNEQALNDYNKAIKLNPNHKNAYNNRGVILASMGNQEQALYDFSKAIELAPDDSDVYFNRGFVFTKEGEDIAGAIEYIKNNPDDASLALQDSDKSEVNVKDTINRYSKIRLEKYNRAIEDYTRAIEHNPKNYRAYYNRAEAYKEIGQKTEAEKDFAKAEALKSLVK